MEDSFPEWKIHRLTKNKIESHLYKVRYKGLRMSSSNFIKRKDVRAFVFAKDDFQCVLCGSKDNLQVDHIISVHRAATGGFPICELNKLNNLQTLCSSCNAAKNP